MKSKVRFGLFDAPENPVPELLKKLQEDSGKAIRLQKVELEKEKRRKVKLDIANRIDEFVAKWGKDGR